MQIKLRDLVEGEEALLALEDMKLPVYTSFKISRLIRRVAPEIALYKTKRNDLIKEYGKETEKGVIQVEKKNMNKFLAKTDELDNMPIDIDLEKIPVSSLGSLDIQPKYLLDWIFE